ncbi:MAG: metal-dependent hydrolase [Anaerolineales bacterium]
MIFGHLAISALEHRYWDADLVPVIIAGLAPDLVDKTACQVLHLAPSGRMAGHTLAGLALSTLLIAPLWGKRAARSWALGYLGHLLGDLNSPVPWLYPFVNYDFKPSPSLWRVLHNLFRDPLSLSLEIALIVWAIVAVLCKRSAPTHLNHLEHISHQR